MTARINRRVVLASALMAAVVSRPSLARETSFAVIDWGLLERNPAQGVKKFRENNVRDAHLQPAEVARLFAAMEGDGNWVAAAAVKFLVLTGLRLREALDARWQHTDLERGFLYLPDTKAGRARHVVLNDAARAVLEEVRARRADGPYVFPGKEPGKPYVNIYQPLARYLAAAGLGHVRPHDFRHTFASLLVGQGVPLFQVQRLLGHSSSAMTTRYAHLSEDTLRESSQVVGRLVGGDEGG